MRNWIRKWLGVDESELDFRMRVLEVGCDRMSRDFQRRLGGHDTQIKALADHLGVDFEEVSAQTKAVKRRKK